MSMSASESATPRLFAKAIATPEDRLRAASNQLFRMALARVEIAADFLVCAAGMFACCAVDCCMRLFSQAQYPLRETVAASILVGLCSVLFLQWDGAYRGGGSLLQIRETERALRVPALSLLLLFALSFLFNLRLSYTSILMALVVIPALLIAQKLLFSSIIRALHLMGVGVDRAVIYGAGNEGKRVVSALFHSLKLGVLPVAVIDDHPTSNRSAIHELGYRRRRSVPVHRGPITPEMLKSSRCSVLILALPNLSFEKKSAAEYAANQAGVRIAFLSGLELQEQMWTQSMQIDGFSLAAKIEPHPTWNYDMAKRMVDLIVSTFLLVFMSPLLCMIAILIKLDSAGPVFFIQKRVGRNGELFNMYKFRSMYTDAPKYEISPVTSRDLRITRIGRFIRKTSLDELPQLINVLLGSMSLVGPRPEMPFIVREYTSEHRQRLQLIPGITGLWQLSADRAFPIHENIQYDLYYIRNRGFFMDIAILIHTLFFAVRRDE
jgi:exopolysaccharide biosynthesis polyprenyl glycosylphosphotransferase